MYSSNDFVHLPICNKVETILHSIQDFCLKTKYHSSLGNLMGKVVNYLKNFWNHIFAYLKDGCYDINNTITEHSFRPLGGGAE